MTRISANADGEAHSDQVWPQQQQQHVELQPGASKHQTAEFFLWTFKIEPCRADYPHNWSLCPYVHPNEKARRRDPRLFEYEPLPCPDDKKGTTCPRGELCNYTHNIYEYWCHPKRFRTQVCQLGGACNRPICFFAHTAQELRRVDQPVHIPPTMTRHPQQLLALEAAAALATASSGGGLVALPQQLPLSPGDAQSLITDPASLLWAAQNACSNGDNEAVPGGIANADLAGAAAAGGGLPGRFAYVQGPNSNPNSNFLLQGAGPGMPASSASSNMGSASMGALSLAGSGSGGSNIMATQLAAATGGTGRGLLLQQQQAAEVELLQAAMQQMGVGNSRYLQDL
ncbi:hypothetical protein OEZ85_001898 [Tetradesmus obliquus]|uniref:C3H1-type domain-containing protein n=1 Tax=Tetradesmus obliquus TaxID=3088 RepID=A0ABY8U1J0_TETOB|nr:hypothetical protein OEZ85_001898 [Tetradesmus obliquus]